MKRSIFALPFTAVPVLQDDGRAADVNIKKTKEPASNTRRIPAIAYALLLLLWFGQAEVKADIIPPTWDLIGTYEIYDFVEGSPTVYELDITTMDFVTGDFSATASGLGTSTVFDGNSQGSEISFDIDSESNDSFGDPVETSRVVEGTIAADGTFSGSVERDNGHGPFYGSWETLSGNATELAPEPSSLSLLALGGLVLLRLTRHRHRV